MRPSTCPLLLICWLKEQTKKNKTKTKKTKGHLIPFMIMPWSSCNHWVIIRRFCLSSTYEYVSGISAARSALCSGSLLLIMSMWYIKIEGLCRIWIGGVAKPSSGGAIFQYGWKQQAFMWFVLVLCSVFYVPTALAVIRGAEPRLSEKTLMHIPAGWRGGRSVFVLHALFYVLVIGHYGWKAEWFCWKRPRVGLAAVY